MAADPAQPAVVYALLIATVVLIAVGVCAAAVMIRRRTGSPADSVPDFVPDDLLDAARLDDADGSRQAGPPDDVPGDVGTPASVLDLLPGGSARTRLAAAAMYASGAFVALSILRLLLGD